MRALDLSNYNARMTVTGFTTAEGVGKQLVAIAGYLTQTQINKLKDNFGFQDQSNERCNILISPKFTKMKNEKSYVVNLGLLNSQLDEMHKIFPKANLIEKAEKSDLVDMWSGLSHNEPGTKLYLKGTNQANGKEVNPDHLVGKNSDDEDIYNNGKNVFTITENGDVIERTNHRDENIRFLQYDLQQKANLPFVAAMLRDTFTKPSHKHVENIVKNSIYPPQSSQASAALHRELAEQVGFDYNTVTVATGEEAQTIFDGATALLENRDGDMVYINKKTKEPFVLGKNKEIIEIYEPFKDKVNYLFQRYSYSRNESKERLKRRIITKAKDDSLSSEQINGLLAKLMANSRESVGKATPKQNSKVYTAIHKEIVNQLVLSDFADLSKKNIADIDGYELELAYVKLTHSPIKDPLANDFVSTDVSAILREFTGATNPGDRAIAYIGESSLTANTFLPSSVPISLYSENDDQSQAYLNDNGAIYKHTGVDSFTLPNKLTEPLVFANCERGELEEKVNKNGLNLTRKDHVHALNILNATKDDTASFICVAPDDMSNIGTVSEASAEFHKHIYQNYKVIDVADASPILQGGNRPQDAYRIYIIGGKRLVPNEKIQPMNTVTLLDAHNVVAQYAHDLADLVEQKKETINVTTDELTSTEDRELLIEKYLQDTQQAVQPDNDLLARYVPITNLATQTQSVMPVAYVPSRIEFAKKLIKDVGNPDQFLLDELQLPEEHVKRVWDAEQIDGLTQGIYRLKKGMPLLVGDMAGKGKGRMLIGMMYWCLNNDIKPIFITESATLLNDIYRDIINCDLESAFNPFVISTKDVVNPEGGQVLRVKQEEREYNKSILKDGGWIQNGENCVLTYQTQLNNYLPFENFMGIAPKDKSRLHPAQLKGAAKFLNRYIKANGGKTALIIDESHGATNPTSKTTRNINTLLNTQTSCNPYGATHLVFSSATSIKTAAKMKALAPFFEGGAGSSAMQSISSSANADIMANLLMQGLVQDGAVLRREHETEKNKTEYIESADKDRNIKLSNQVSEILKMGKDFSDLQIESVSQKRFSSDEISGCNFANSHHILSKIFTNALVADEIVRNMIDDANNKRKPIYATGETGEADLNYLFDKLAKEHEHLPKNERPTEYKLDEYPTFAISLERWHESSQYKTYDLVVPPTPAEINAAALKGELAKNKIEKVKVHWRDALDPLSPEFIEIDAHYKSINKKINEMDKIPAIPLDHIRISLEDAGVSVSEVNARSIQVEKRDNGYFLTKINRGKLPSREQVVQDFNTNKNTCIIGTTALTTGISLHANSKLLEYGEEAIYQRVTYKTPLTDPTKTVQYDGRADRKGRIGEKALYKAVITGLPCEAKIYSLQTRQLSAMGSITTGSSDALKDDKHTDFYSPFGNKVVTEYLIDNPQIMDEIGFTKADIERVKKDQNRNTTFNNGSSKLLGYLLFLDVKEQAKIMDEIECRFSDELKIAKSKGVNPLDVSMMAGSIEIIQTDVLKPGTGTESFLDAPLLALHVEQTLPDTQMTEIQMNKLMTQGDLAIKQNSLIDYHGNPQKFKTLAELSGWLYSDDFKTLYENRGKLTTTKDKENRKLITSALNSLNVGTVIDDPHSVREDAQAIIVGIDTPNYISNALSPYSYNFELINSQGESSSASLRNLVKDDSQAITDIIQGKYSSSHPINQTLLSYKKEGTKEHHLALAGNLTKGISYITQGGRNNGEVTKAMVKGESTPITLIKMAQGLTLEKILKMSLAATQAEIDILKEALDLKVTKTSFKLPFEHASANAAKGTNGRLVNVRFNHRLDEIVILAPKYKKDREGFVGPDPLHITGASIHHDAKGDVSTYCVKLGQLQEVVDGLDKLGFKLNVSANYIELLSNNIQDYKDKMLNATPTPAPTTTSKESMAEAFEVEWDGKSTSESAEEHNELSEPLDFDIEEEKSNVVQIATKVAEQRATEVIADEDDSLFDDIDDDTEVVSEIATNTKESGHEDQMDFSESPDFDEYDFDEDVAEEQTQSTQQTKSEAMDDPQNFGGDDDLNFDDLGEENEDQKNTTNTAEDTLSSLDDMDSFLAETNDDESELEAQFSM